MVADGMGGRAGGDVASRIAIDTLTAKLASNGRSDVSNDERIMAVQRAIRTSNQAIRDEAVKRQELIGMGTTIVIGAIAHDTAGMIVAHVGDSRAYLLRHGALSRLTRDHSLVEEALAQGELSEEQALEHPLRHMLTRAVGAEPDVDPDVSVTALHPHDLILMCTDGLTKMLSDDDILAILSRARASSEATCAALVTEANRRGGDDNVSVIIVRNDEK
jgi:protein phosphatase